MRILFVCKENKNNDFTPQFLLFHVSLRHVFMRVPRHMRVMFLLMPELTFWHRTQMCCGLFTSRGRCTMYIKQSSSTCLKILTERMTCNFCPALLIPTRICRRWSQLHHTYASWYSCESASKTDTEEKKLLNKVIIFVFFAHKKYSHSFKKIRLNHWCHMVYFNDVLATFLGFECVSCTAVYGGSESSRIS